MNELDSIVRRSLEERVQSPPRMTDTANRAIHGARKMRRRRLARTVGGAAMALVVFVGALAALRGAFPGVNPLAPPDQQVGGPSVSTPAGLRPDLLLGEASTDSGWVNLLPADGPEVSLRDVTGSVEAAYAITEGWLVEAVTTDNARALWLVPPTGAMTRLLDKVEGLAVAPDGHRMAWRSDGRIRVGRLSGTRLSTDTSTPAPQRGVPIAYNGTDVVLGYGETGGGVDHFDTWAPGRGNYLPSWSQTAHVIAVYPPATDGSLFGLVRSAAGDQDVCLAQLNPSAELHPIRTVCGLPFLISPPALVSPDGRWLAAPSLNAANRQEVALVDLHTVFDQPKVIVTWAALRPVAWLNDDSLALGTDHDTAVIAQTAGPGLTPLTTPSAGPQGRVQPVRRLGVKP